MNFRGLYNFFEALRSGNKKNVNGCKICFRCDVFIVNFEHIFSSVSVGDFEQVSVSWTVLIIWKLVIAN